jgi:Zn-dependent protease with chaperone function
MKTPSLHLLILLLASAALPIAAYAQPIDAVVKERLRITNRAGTEVSRLEPGEPIQIEGYHIGLDAMNQLNWKISTAQGERYMQARHFDALAVDYPALSPQQLWHLALLRSEALSNRPKLGAGHEARAELEEEYVKLEEQLRFITDPFLDDYLNTLLRQIYTGPLPLERRGVLQVRLYDATDPTAFACENGAIYLSTGLLSTLRSEDELFAILANQVGHVILDHSAHNYLIVERGIARAQFWSTLLTTAAAVGEIAAARSLYRRGYADVYWAYNAGDFTLAVNDLASTIAFKIATRLGMEYTTEQYREADEIALQMLENQGRDKTALNSALARIIDHYRQINQVHTLQADATLKYLRSRQISLLRALELYNYDTPTELDLPYLRKISLVNLATATREFALGRYERASQFSQLNIDAGVAVPEDFLLQSAIIRRTQSAPEALEQAFVFLEQARARARRLPREYHVEKALVHLRLEQNDEARAALEAYEQMDPHFAAASFEGESAMQWWVRNMLEKL